jgi:membrane fusion protein, multidrug efflux system
VAEIRRTRKTFETVKVPSLAMHRVHEDGFIFLWIAALLTVIGDTPTHTVRTMDRILISLCGAGSALPAALLAVLVVVGPVSAQQVPRVVVAVAEMTEVSQTAAFNGRVVASQKVDLRARISGFVQEIGFVEGGTVAEGKVLFRLEDDTYRFALDQAEASVASAQSAEALALIERDRQKELNQRGSAADAVLQRAEADYQGRVADVRRLEAQRDQAALNLSYAEVKAPFVGRVGLAAVDVGALVGPETGPLLTLVKTDPMMVEFPVPERELLQFQAKAAEVSGTLALSLVRADGSLYNQQGTLNFADVTVNQGTDTILMRASFPNPEGTLTDGALVSVRLAAEGAAPQLTVPQQAVQRDLTGPYVLVVGADNVVQPRRVDVERLADGLAVIASGLSEGEQVITEGVNKVRPGMTVDAALAGQG